MTIACTPDGKMLAHDDENNAIHLIDIDTGKRRASLFGHTGFVSQVAFSPDGTLLASASDDRSIRLWDVASGTEVAKLVGHPETVRGVTFSPDGKSLASCGFGDVLRMWDVADRHIKWIASSNADYWIAFSPDSKSIATAGENLALWEAPTGRFQKMFPEEEASSIYRVDFNPGGKSIASTRCDGEIVIWTTTPLQKVRTLEKTKETVESMSHSRDGKLLAAGYRDGSVRLWSPSDGKLLATLRGRHRDRVKVVQFSADDKTLLTASYDGFVERWDVESRRRFGD